MRKLLLIVFAFISINSFAEKIDGPANVRDAANGKIIFELVDNAIIYAQEPINNWFKIQVMVKVDKSALTEDFFVKPNSKLIDYYHNNPLLGYSKDTIKPLDYFSYETGFVVIIEGFTYKNNIRTESIVELDLNRILNFKQNISKSDFSNHIDQFEYAEPIAIGNYEYIRTYDPEPETPLIRCGLLFDKNGNLVALFNKNRTVNYKFKKSEEIVHGYVLHYLKDNADNLKVILNDYLQSTN